MTAYSQRGMRRGLKSREPRPCRTAPSRLTTLAAHPPPATVRSSLAPPYTCAWTGDTGVRWARAPSSRVEVTRALALKSFMHRTTSWSSRLTRTLDNVSMRIVQQATDFTYYSLGIRVSPMGSQQRVHENAVDMLERGTSGRDVVQARTETLTAQLSTFSGLLRRRGARELAT